MGFVPLTAIAAILTGVFFWPPSQNVVAPAWRCRAKPVEPCFTHHGRLSSQNGIAFKIWLIGTKRVVSVDNDPDDMRAYVLKYLDLTSPDHSYISGDFEICPLAPDKPGHMRPVCVTGAARLAVQDVGGSRPAFWLRSTWPRDTTDDR